METDETDIKSIIDYNVEDSYSAVNSSILDYYKKFGRKRDLEQFFSLSTTQSDIRDPSSVFWRRMKSQYDSSDSGENKRSESSTELCRISIKCSIPEPIMDSNTRTKMDSDSPPIISEDAMQHRSRSSDNDSDKSNYVQSQKSNDCPLDTSMNKPISPTSSVTSQRKLEWDSLADVGYANESHRKNSASSLSTLERMALQQQYSNETKHNPELGPPTAQSTPLDANDTKSKSRKGEIKKTTKIYKKDVDLFKLSVPQTSEYMKPINVNLTKHISFNVEKDGGVSVENMTKSISLSPEKVSVETAITPLFKIDKEIQTTLIKNKDNSVQPVNEEPVKRTPVLLSLNSLKKRVKKRKIRKVKSQNSRKKTIADKENIPEKHVEQASEAESFEYMPGHIYNQNQLKIDQDKMNSGNKSSLESSAGLTTDSSKTTKYSFTKDLEKGIDMLKNTLDNRCDDTDLKKRLIKEFVQRLIKSKYKDDDSSTEFLSGLTFGSKKLDMYNTNQTTTSTSEGTMKIDKVLKPKKSILRMDKFNSGPIASTSQSVPNLHTVTNSDKPIASNMGRILQLSNTDSDVSSKNRNAFDIGVDKTSSKQLYQKYLEALKREQAYKKHLKDKELFLKQKLVSSDNAFNVTRQTDIKTQNKIKNLMKDLIRNNYDDGSGDASKLEVGSNSNIDFERYNFIRKQRSHSVFTLSSGNSDNHYKQAKLTSKCTQEADTSKPSCNITDKHYCCCPYHKLQPKVGVTDSSVQVNIKCCKEVSPERKQRCSSSCGPTPASHHIQELVPFRCEKCNTISKPHKIAKCVAGTGKDYINYVCLCTEDHVTTDEVPENILIYKCSRNDKGLKMDTVSKASNTISGHSSNSTSPRKISTFESQDCERKCLIIKDSNGFNTHTKSSQTDLNLRLALRQGSSEQSTQSSSSENKNYKCSLESRKPSVFIHEATRVVQTEISIDPKISDPSISDINIVNDECCVQLISEQYKEVSQNSSDNDVSKRVDNDAMLHVGHCKPTKAVEEKKSAKCTRVTTKEISTNTIEKIDKEIQSSPEVTKVLTSDDNNKKDPNNFTIPIQGTNMTLKVSLGSGNRAISNNITHQAKTDEASKGTETIKNDVVDNFTSLRDECSKGVQSSKNNVFKDFYEKPKSTCCEGRNNYRGKDSELRTKQSSKLPTKSCSVNTCITDDKYNTYPKNAQKPLLRSNTDTGKMEKSCRVTFNKGATKVDGVQTGPITDKKQSKSIATEINQEKYDSCCSEKSLKSVDVSGKSKLSSDIEDQLKSTNSESDTNTNQYVSRDPLIEMIQDITKRYSKKDLEKSKRTKCFKEIITVLNYFLDTEESTDQDQNKASCSSACDENSGVDKIMSRKECCDSNPKKSLVDKGIQLSTKKSKTNKTCTESSDLPTSTDLPSTSSDSATCKVLNKIKRECEKYHQKRCKSNSVLKKCEASSSTSVNCDQCRRVHHCSCRGHKCKNHKTKTTVEKTKRKCFAYNLIIQTSDSVVSEEVTCRKKQRQLQNIIVKVPSKRKVESIPFKEMATTIKRDLPHCSPRCGKNYRSKSCPNESEISSTDEIIRKAQEYNTVREYLEKNRPDFVEKSSNRQNCLKLINETRPKDCESSQLRMVVVHTPRCAGNNCMDPCNMYCGGMPINSWGSCMPPNNMHCGQNEVTRIASERSNKRQLLSLQLDRQQTLGALTNLELKNLARELGNELRRKKVKPKFINEREMKKHSEKIYKSLPEVTLKKEEMKKENMKKTNLLMASIFKKNLQKKTLSGAVNLSNYSTVIKI